ncbi:Queuine tRNA-ribosyltransferase subunit qtrtd1 [Mortierella claussenii]|nr:Queuine tRNA-ribosyltransferase subunit qtrtd1 [Mortierella claussenii]
MSPLTFNIIRQSTQRSAAARRGTVVIATNSSDPNDASTSTPKTKKRVMETPGCFMYTVKGSVPHLTPDTLRQQSFGGVNVSIEHILQEHQPAEFEKHSGHVVFPSLSKFLSLQDFIVFCDIRDSSRYTKMPFNSDRHVSISTHQGVRQLTLEEYFKVVRAYEPDIVAAFADSISDLDQNDRGIVQGPGHGQKRVRKSVDRSLKWLDQILRERQGFDSVAEDKAMEEIKKKRMKEERGRQKEHGKGFNMQVVDQIVEEARNLVLDPTSSSSSSAEAKRTTKPWLGVSVFAHVGGAQIEQERVRSAEETAKRQGVDGYIIDTLALPGTREEVLNLLKVSIDHLPKEKPRLVYGMQTPEDVLKSIAVGADVFDTSYPSQLTEDGKASLYSFGTTASSSTAADQPSVSKRWINLWDEEHADKFVPLLDGCECYACKGGRHTRAYINHLLKAHEMLATVLLMSHNMHQYSKFFANVRHSIEDGTFEQQSNSFIERFGVEPERTGEIHAAQAIIEAALSKRNRLDGANGDAAAAAAVQAAEEKRRRKEQMRNARHAKKKEEGLKWMVNKKEMRLEKKLQQRDMS